VATHPVDGEDVVGVLHGFEIEEQRREAEHTKGGGREDRALQAVGGALVQHAPGRPRRRRQVVGHGVEGPLHPVRRSKRAQRAELARIEADAHAEVRTIANEAA
jgi:hypothetical protein